MEKIKMAYKIKKQKSLHIKESMSENEAERLYKYEIAEGKINTEDTPHYDSFIEYKNMLIDSGIKIK